MTQDVIRQALSLWGMQDATAELAAQRENTVWRVRHGGADFALRFHRPMYRTTNELTSELLWMQHLAQNGLTVPRPIPMPDGTLITKIGDHHISLLTWLPGQPIGAIDTLHNITDPAAMCHQLGQDMARLHDLSDTWQPPVGFTRPDWRKDGLLGDTPLWGRFWEHPHLDADQKTILLRARDAAHSTLARIEPNTDQGLIHADLLVENIMIDDGTLAFIDFDDGAFGYRDFELATFLIKFITHPDYPDMRAALFTGYASRRTVSPDDLDLFLLLRALTYPGWIMARLNEPGGAERSARAIETALNLSNEFLKRRA